MNKHLDTTTGSFAPKSSFATDGTRPSCSKPEFTAVRAPLNQPTANNTQKNTFRDFGAGPQDENQIKGMINQIE